MHEKDDSDYVRFFASRNAYAHNVGQRWRDVPYSMYDIVPRLTQVLSHLLKACGMRTVKGYTKSHLFYDCVMHSSLMVIFDVEEQE